MIEYRLARMDDLKLYVAFADRAQRWLVEQGLGQYVPAAHEEYAGSIRALVERGALYAACCDAVAVAFFGLEAMPSQWWPANDVPALYLAGMVVSADYRGRGVGREIIRWCVSEAVRLEKSLLRLDCHADNAWLRSYYESQGFELQREIDMHPGYRGCLYQRLISSSSVLP